MTRADEALARLEELFAAIETFDEPVRSIVLEFLDGVDALHRTALAELVGVLPAQHVERARTSSPAVDWLLDAYDLGPAHPPEEREVPVMLRARPGR